MMLAEFEQAGQQNQRVVWPNAGCYQQRGDGVRRLRRARTDAPCGRGGESLDVVKLAHFPGILCIIDSFGKCP